ncbi:MAG: type II secretion system protein M [Alphaproteobacteria bacterium]|nr:type II secretion system protein M [Alphaproteobacteria bacterium]
MSVIDNARARVSGAFAPLLNRVEAMLDGLSPRDRKLLGGLVTFAVLLIVLGGAYLMVSTLDSVERKIAERTGDLQYVRLQQAEYEASQETIQKIEEELRSHQGTPFSAFVERTATEAQVKEQLNGINPSSESRIGNLEQKNYKVEFSRVEIAKFFKFLETLETSGYPLRITNASFKTAKTGDQKLLNVNLEIAAFKLIDEGSEG